MSFSRGPMTRSGAGNARPARNSAVTTIATDWRGVSLDSLDVSSATEARADAGRGGPNRFGDCLLCTACREAVRRAVDVNRRDELAARVRDGCRHRGDTHRELVAYPRVAVAAHVPQALEQRGRVRERVGREALERLCEVPSEHRCGQL